MAHHKSTLKRIKTNERDAQRNKQYMSRLKTQIKKMRAVQDKEEGEKLYRETSSYLDKLVNKGLIHRNKAANQKSKFAAVVQKLEK
ncbi:30S ribosomal protein S20 [candidate division KSB1 bacterium]|nr:30S ribosomal protein S20 [candidate division KSB1 bacterium]RQW06523.1 MAG: 30S ribosomal protein S20 [candidate division KSB1 bacterium]